MTYFDGTEAQLGDVITVRRDGIDVPGVVAKVVQPNSKEAEEWNLPDGGILIEGGGLGLFATHRLSEDNDIAFVRRSQNLS
jgi:hypothetical protein